MNQSGERSCSKAAAAYYVCGVVSRFSLSIGRSMPDDRGALMHEVLLSCGAFEKDFAVRAVQCGDRV